MPAHTRQGSHWHRALTLGGARGSRGPPGVCPRHSLCPWAPFSCTSVFGGAWLPTQPASRVITAGSPCTSLETQCLSWALARSRTHLPRAQSTPNLPAQAPRPWELRLSQISGEVQTHWSATAPEKHLGWWTHGQCLLLRGHRGAPWGPPSRKNLGLRGKEHQLTASSSIFRDSNPLLLMF